MKKRIWTTNRKSKRTSGKPGAKPKSVKNPFTNVHVIVNGAELSAALASLLSMTKFRRHGAVLRSRGGHLFVNFYGTEVGMPACGCTFGGLRVSKAVMSALTAPSIATITRLTISVEDQTLTVNGRRYPCAWDPASKPLEDEADSAGITGSTHRMVSRHASSPSTLDAVGTNHSSESVVSCGTAEHNLIATIEDSPRTDLSKTLKRFSKDGDHILQCHAERHTTGRGTYLTVSNADRVAVACSVTMKSQQDATDFIIPRECLIALRSATRTMQRMSIHVYDTHIFIHWHQKALMRRTRLGNPMLMWVEEAVAGDVLGTTIQSHFAEEDRRNAELASYRGRVRQRGARLREFIAVRVTPNTPCPYCDSPIGTNWQADHIMPIKRGGLSMLTNLVAVCYKCNQTKRSKSLAQFIQAKAFEHEVVISRLQLLGKRVDDIDPDPQLSLF